MVEFSICIPRISNEITKKDIFHAFRKLYIGHIQRIDIVYNKVTRNRRAFVHYKYTYKTSHSNLIIDQLENKEYINLVYKFPHYWRCFKSFCKVPNTDTQQTTSNEASE